MRGDDLLLAHLKPVREPGEDGRPSARDRLEAELGREFTDRLLAALAPREDAEPAA